MSETCLHDGCEVIGVFPVERVGDDGEVITGVACWDHSGDGPVVAAEPDDFGFHTDVVAGLAAVLLEHTAMTVLDAPDATGDAMRSLAGNTGWTEDVAAGVLLATTWIMAAGQVDAEQLLHGAELYEQQAESEDAEPVAAIDGDDQGDGDVEAAGVEVHEPADDAVPALWTMTCDRCDASVSFEAPHPAYTFAHAHRALHDHDQENGDGAHDDAMAQLVDKLYGPAPVASDPNELADDIDAIGAVIVGDDADANVAPAP